MRGHLSLCPPNLTRTNIFLYILHVAVVESLHWNGGKVVQIVPMGEPDLIRITIIILPVTWVSNLHME